MGTQGDILVRIDEIEAEVRELFGELHELRALVAREAAEQVVVKAEAPAVETPPVPPAAETPVAAPAAPPPTAPPAAPAAPAAAPSRRSPRAAILAARVLLSDGRPSRALDELKQGLVYAHESHDREGLESIARELEGIARYRASVRGRALDLASLASEWATLERPSAAAPKAESGAPRPAVHAPVARTAPVRPPQPAAPPSPPRRSLGDLAREWDLLGPRGFAIVGGAVTGLGIILLFVLAANRGWITPGMRVLIGFAASAAAVGAGLWVRSRYGQMQSSLGAVGAGIAGGYASLAAAAARYDLVPDWLALPLAAVIAGVAVAIALAWRSQIVAGIGLFGSALAPALQAIDTGMEWPSAAFAVIVFAATVVLTVPRRWHPLLVSIGLVVTAQVLWLADEAAGAAGAGTTAVAAALVLVVLAAATWLQLASAGTDLDQLSTSFAFAAVGLALVLAPVLYDADRDAGLLLAGAAVVWGAVWLALRRAQPSFALLAGVSALALAAVATADLLSGTSLAVTWAAESALFSVLAWRLRDARLQLSALAYAALAAGHTWTVDVPSGTIFQDPVAGNAAVSVAAVALAVLAAGLLAPAETVPRTETGMLAWLAVARSQLAARREGLREALVFGGVAAGTYALALALVSISFRPGHLAATIAAAAVGAVVTAASARRASAALVVASFVWLGGILAVALAFDVPEFALDTSGRSYGGWSLLAAAAGVLAGSYAFQLLLPERADEGVRTSPAGWDLLDPDAYPVPAALGGMAALASSAAAIALLSPAGDVLSSTWVGWRLLAPALVFFALSAAVFRIPRHRDLATWMWALGTAALLGSEWLVVRDVTWRTVAFAVTVAALAGLERPLRETRLWQTGLGLGLATATFAVGWAARPWELDVDQPVRLAVAPLAAAAALFVVAALSWGARRDPVTIAWAVALVALVDAEAFLIQDATWIAVAVAATAALTAALERPLAEERLWLAGWSLAVATAAATLYALAGAWIADAAEPAVYAAAAFAVAASLVAVSALAWRLPGRRDLVTISWATAVVSLIFAEAFLVGGGPAVAFASALTGGGVALLAGPLRESRLWWGGTVVVGVTSAAVLALLTPPSHFVTASASPGDGLWVAIACLVGGAALHLADPAHRKWVDAIASVGALYVLSLGILELAERAFGGSVQTDFERGHVGVSVVWALIGLALLVAGLIRDEHLLRYGGLALFGLSLAKIFVYDLSTLSPAARALSFIAVGALVLAGGFFLQRLSSHMGPRKPHTPS
jgi:uncharacterized membrane protein